MPYANLTFTVQPGLRFKPNDFVNLYGSDATTTTTTTIAGGYTSIGTGFKVLGGGNCNSIGSTPTMYLDATDYAKYVSYGGCLSDGVNKVSVIRDVTGTPISGTFYFVFYGGSCSTTTFKSTNGNITIDTVQC